VSTFARIIIQDGIEAVAEVVDFTPARFGPEIAALFVPATAGMVYRARKINGVWVAPPEPEPQPEPEPAAPAPAPNRTKVSRTEYYGQFTAPEEAMIRIAAGEDVTVAKLGAANAAEKQRLMAVAALQVMLRRTDALAPTDTIELASSQVKEGLGLLVAMSLLTNARKTEIEAGIKA
jgi:hypothetical protein